FSAEPDQRFRKFVARKRGRAQPLYSVAAIGDGLLSLIDCGFQRLVSFGGAIREHESHRVNLQQYALKTLEQGVVQIPRDACPLIDSCFQTHIESPGDLSHPQLIENNEQY